jgi:hypothetical protein
MKSILSLYVMNAAGSVFRPRIARHKDIKDGVLLEAAYAKQLNMRDAPQYQIRNVLGGVGGALDTRNTSGVTTVDSMPRTRICVARLVNIEPPL